jgi:hypothetical protein
MAAVHKVEGIKKINKNYINPTCELELHNHTNNQKFRTQLIKPPY